MTARDVTRTMRLRDEQRERAERGLTLDQYLGDGPNWSEVIAMAQAGSRITEAVNRAVARGALVSAASAERWLARGDEAADQVDMLEGCEILARDNQVRASSGYPQARAFQTEGTPLSGYPDPAPPRGKERWQYALNPLVAKAQQERGPLVRAAAAEQPAPELFEDGPLPMSTASGADPRALMRLPWQLRHPAAAAATPAKFHRICESRHNEAEVAGYEDYPENADYRQAVSDWLAGRNVPVDPKTGVKAGAATDAFSVEELHDALFGDT